MEKVKTRNALRGVALCLAAMFALAALPAPAKAATGTGPAILLSGLRVVFQTGTNMPAYTYYPQQSVTADGVVYTIDETETLLMGGTNIDHARDLFLRFETRRDGGGDDLVPVFYENSSGVVMSRDGDWSTGGAIGYGDNGYILPQIVKTTRDFTSDPDYYLYKFRFYAGEFGSADFTDYTLRLKRHPKTDEAIYPHRLYAGHSQTLVTEDRVARESFKQVPGKSYREYVWAKNVTFPYTIHIRFNNYYKNRAYINGVEFTADQYANGADFIYTFTAAKPYLDLKVVPGDVDTETIHYVTGAWRISVAGKASLANAVVSKVSSKAYTGKQIKPAVTVQVNGKTLKKGTDYTVKYGANKKIGKGTISFSGKGKYSGSKKISFDIVPKKNSVAKLSVGKGQMQVKWKKVSAAQKITKYQVRYRVAGTTKWKTKSYKASAASATIKSLKKGKAYQVQVRSYKTVAGKKYYSAWSTAKTSKKIK